MLAKSKSFYSHLKRHGLKLFKPRSTRQIRQNFFSASCQVMLSRQLGSTTLRTITDHWNDVALNDDDCQEAHLGMFRRPTKGGQTRQNVASSATFSGL